MVRELLQKQPEWNQPFTGWAAGFIKKNRWKYEDIHTFTDLMQDAYITFRHVLASYPLITEPSHIMALFQSAMRNDLIDKAKYRSRKHAHVVSLDAKIPRSSDEGTISIADLIGENNNEGYLRIILNELPPEVRAALEVFNDDEKLELLRKKKQQSKLSKLAGFPQRRETLNDVLCKILGLKKDTDLVGMLYEALAKH